jgi:ATP-dependent DNA helicase RecQ
MKTVLKKYFGFEEFRPIQKDAIEKILSKKSVLVVLPTGSGKSLIYQLPTIMMDGVTIVISPLIALMQDQVANLKINGIKAEMISSQNSFEENQSVFKKLQNKEIKLLYVAPERFTNEYFLEQLKQIDINFFVIDEAHCVSEWGHEFREDYRKLGFLKTLFPNTPISAFTATATKSVQEDIVKTLSIPTKNILKTSMTRDNLFIRVQRRVADGKKQIKAFLDTHSDECGIVYCFTRKECEKLSDYLNNNGYKTLAYHAGLPSQKRDEIFKKFKSEEVKVIVATIAFGMGIDKSNIRFVLHTSMPKTLENYSQEIGRAGRDGLNSDVLLLFSKADEIAKQRFVDELEEGKYKENAYKKLQTMYRYCISSKCRHQFLAEYFGDETLECQKLCDNCLEKKKSYHDITIEAQKFLSAVYRTDERFGQNHIIEILRGSKNKRLLEFNHDKLSVYGIGKDFSKEQWSIVVDKLLDMDAIMIDGEFRVLKLTPVAKRILKKELDVKVEEKLLQKEKSFKKYKKDDTKSEHFEEFRALRYKLSQEENIPPYIVFSDKTLNEISQKLPTTKEEFLAINGVGEMKLKKYGEIFMWLSGKIREAK